MEKEEQLRIYWERRKNCEKGKHKLKDNSFGITWCVICGHRHHNCIFIFSEMVGFPYSEEARELQNTEVQGFLTNLNRFVNREEAWIIAEKADQIIIVSGGKGTLYSEDLY